MGLCNTLRRLLRIIPLIGVSINCGHALTIDYSARNPFDGSPSDAQSIVLSGEIIPGDYENLIKLIRKDPARFLVAPGIILASSGGDVLEALKIAEFVKRSYSAVFVGPAAGRCASACFFIFINAPFRIAVSPNLGIHRPYLHSSRLAKLSVKQAEDVQRDVARRVRQYLQERDIPAALADRMFQLASTEVHWLTREEIISQIGARPPWYEQYLIAKCGLDKELEGRSLDAKLKDQKPVDHTVAVETCGRALAATEKRNYLRELMNMENR